MEKYIKHKDLEEIKVKLQWEGDNNQIVLVESVYRIKPHFYCLWGSASKSISELASVECITPTGRTQGQKAAIKLFDQMVKSAMTVSMS